MNTEPAAIIGKRLHRAEVRLEEIEPELVKLRDALEQIAQLDTYDGLEQARWIAMTALGRPPL